MSVTIHVGDALGVLRGMASGSVQMCVTSPPYWGMRDYGVEGQLGLEPTPEAYVEAMVGVFREVRRVLRDDGVLWLNMGDCYATAGGAQVETRREALYRNYGRVHGAPDAVTRTQPNRVTGGRKDEGQNARWHGKHFLTDKQGDMARSRPARQAIANLKPKDLVGMPWRLAFALQADGWWLRKDNIWFKRNTMPESAGDRCTTAHEYVFHLTKAQHYFYDAHAVREPQTGNAHSRGQGVTPKSADNGDAFTRAKKNWHESTAEWTESPNMRNRRSVWDIPTFAFPEAHFATFPPKLAEVCIKSGSSELGACPGCGAPWSRVVANTPEYAARLGSYHDHSDVLVRGQRGVPERFDGPRDQTIAWEKPCGCAMARPVPCVVLDPFAGAGTTGLVSAWGGRDAVLIELSPQYAAMAGARIEREAGLLTRVEVVESDPGRAGAAAPTQSQT